MKLTLTYRILTEEPGSYLVFCENYPLIAVHCKTVKRCVDAAKNKTKAVVRTCKEDIIRNYNFKKRAINGWRFQLVYNLEEDNCEKVISSQDHNDK